MKPRTLSWGQVVCIMDQYKAPPKLMIEKFNLDPEDLATAVELWNAGVLNVTNFDVSSFGDLLGLVSVNSVITTKKDKKKGKVDSVFELITTTPVDLDVFMRDNDVSINILRQSKRFDKTGLGKVRIKNNQIWREATTET